MSAINLDIKNKYDLWSFDYDTHKNPLVALEEKHIYSLLEPSTKVTNILDLACGTGRHISNLLKLYPKSSFVGIDFSDGMLSLAERKFSEYKNIKFIHSSLEKKLTIASNSFDLVICGLALSHVKNIKLLVSEVSRVLKKNGVFLFSDLHSESIENNWITHFHKDDKTYKIKNYIRTPIFYKKLLKSKKLIANDIISFKVKHLPQGYLDSDKMKMYSEMNFCMIMKAIKS